MATDPGTTHGSDDAHDPAAAAEPDGVIREPDDIAPDTEDGETGEARRVDRSGSTEPMPDEVAIRALSLVLAPDAPPRYTVAEVNWPLLAAAYRTRGALRIVDDVLGVDPDPDPDKSIPETEFGKALREGPRIRSAEAA